MDLLEKWLCACHRALLSFMVLKKGDKIQRISRYRSCVMSLCLRPVCSRCRLFVICQSAFHISLLWLFPVEVILSEGQVSLSKWLVELHFVVAVKRCLWLYINTYGWCIFSAYFHHCCLHTFHKNWHSLYISCTVY